MNKNRLIEAQIHTLFSEIEYLIRLLYVTHDAHMKNLTLNQLWNKVEQLRFLFQFKESAASEELLSKQPQPSVPSPPAPLAAVSAPPTAAPIQHGGQPSAALPPASPQNLQTITRQQLAQFDGRNGKPAYVAVNGVVYDVTNNAAWSAATHFGLTAGKDLSREFASCHAAEQWILTTLTPVGRLTD